MKDFFRDMLDQAWTLVGLVIGFIVLEGGAKTFTGYLITGVLVLWVATFPLRKSD